MKIQILNLKIYHLYRNPPQKINQNYIEYFGHQEKQHCWNKDTVNSDLMRGRSERKSFLNPVVIYFRLAASTWEEVFPESNERTEHQIKDKIKNLKKWCSAIVSTTNLLNQFTESVLIFWNDKIAHGKKFCRFLIPEFNLPIHVLIFTTIGNIYLGWELYYEERIQNVYG